MNKGKLVVNGIEMDLKSGLSFGLNYSIDDVKKVEKKNSNYSKTLTLVGSRVVNKFMGGLFDVNADFTFFNPNNKTDAKIIVNSSTVIEGALQLKAIDIIGDTVEYKCTIVSKSIDFMSEIKDKLLNEVDLSEYNHLFTGLNVTDTWNNTEGICYPLFYKGSNDYNLTDFKPAIFYKTYLNKIAEAVGYSFGGSLMDHTTEEGIAFAKEIIPFSGAMPLLPESEFTRRKFRASPVVDTVFDTGTLRGIDQGNMSYTLDDSGYLNVFTDDSTGANFDNGGVFNTGTNTYTVDANGGYSMSTQVKVKMNFSTASIEAWQHSYRQQAGVAVNNWNDNNLETPYVVTFRYTKNGVDMGNLSTGIIYAPSAAVDGDSTFNAANGYSVDVEKDFTLNVPNQNLSVSDEIKVTYNIDVAPSLWRGTYTTTYIAASTDITGLARVDMDWTAEVVASGTYMYNTPKSSVLSLNDEVVMNTFIPSKLKQTDLINDLVKRLNIYVSVDPENERKIILDTRDAYYAKGGIVDWTNLRDEGSKETIKLLSELQNKEMLFTYKKGSDTTSELYFDATEQIYGEKKIAFDNDFAKGEKKIESIFASTVLIPNRAVSQGVPSSVVSHWSVDPALNKGVTVMYFGGAIPTIEGRDFRVHFNDTGTFFWSRTEYPYAGHLDNPFTPTIDINFGNTSAAYPFRENNTDANLYNRYWKNYVSQINEGKLVTMKLNLNEVIIDSIRKGLNAKVWVKDSYYTINKVVDYDPINNGLTKVELLKIKEGVAFVPVNNVLDNADYVSDNDSFKGGSTNTNQNASDSSLIVGVGNVIEEGVVSGFINGNYNIITKDVKGGYVIGSDNKVITQDNEGYIGDVHYLDGIVQVADNSMSLADLFTLRDNDGLVAGVDYHASDLDYYFTAVTSNELDLNGRRVMRVVEASLYTTLDIFNLTTSYIESNRVIWGGRVWICIANGTSTSLDNFTLNPSHWTLSTDTVDYEYKTFKILYSEQLGNLSEQSDNKGNVLYNGTINGGFEFSDWNDARIYKNRTSIIINNNCSQISENRCMRIIGNNTNATILRNNINGDISTNIVSRGGQMYILDNVNNGDIQNNTTTVGMSIFNNNNNGDISAALRAGDVAGTIVNI